MELLDMLADVKGFFDSLIYLVDNIPFMTTCLTVLFSCIVLKCTIFRGV